MRQWKMNLLPGTQVPHYCLVLRWVRQFTANDAYTAACNLEFLNHPNCPDPTGPDVDFGAATMLVKSKAGRELVIAGQKSADVHAMNPETGEVVWT